MENGGAGRGRGRGRGSVGGEAEDRADLRRPLVAPPGVTPRAAADGSVTSPPVSSCPTPNATNITSPTTENKPPPKKTFTLSADAPEFVPRSFVPAAPQPQQQQFPQISQQMGKTD